MDKVKQWVVLTAVGVVAILVAGWFLLVAPKHSEADDLEIQAAAQADKNSLLVSRISLLKEQAKDAPRQSARLAAVAAKLPDNPAMPGLIRALTAAADRANVELVSLSPTTPVPLVAAPAAAGATVGATGAAGGTGAAPAAAPAASLQSIGLAINVVGGYFQIEQFLDSVENLTRAVRVTGLNIAPGSNPVAPVSESATAVQDPGKVLAAQINGFVYMTSAPKAAVVPTVAGK